MKKALTLMLACFVFFAGFAKHEPDPVIVNLPVDEAESSALPEAVRNLNNEYASGTGGLLIDENESWSAPETAVSDAYNRELVSVAVGKKPDVVYVPTQNDVVEKMLELAQVQKDDLLYDLGCGVGRIVVAAAKRIGCRAIGYDIDPKRVKESLDNVARNKIEKLTSGEDKAQHKVFLWTPPLPKRKKQARDDLDSEITFDYGMSEIEDRIRSSELPVPLIHEP